MAESEARTVARGLRWSEIKSFQVSLKRCKWQRKPNVQWHWVPYSRSAHIKSTFTNWSASSWLSKETLVRWPQQTRRSIRCQKRSEVCGLVNLDISSLNPYMCPISREKNLPTSKHHLLWRMSGIWRLLEPSRRTFRLYSCGSYGRPHEPNQSRLFSTSSHRSYHCPIVPGLKLTIQNKHLIKKYVKKLSSLLNLCDSNITLYFVISNATCIYYYYYYYALI